MSAHLVPMHSSALCQTWFVIRKRTSFKAARESRFGGRWNLQNVQGGSVGGYGLLTWFLWISPPPFRTPLDRYCWGFLYCSWRQVLTRCNFGFKSSSTDCWSKPFLIKLFLLVDVIATAGDWFSPAVAVTCGRLVQSRRRCDLRETGSVPPSRGLVGRDLSTLSPSSAFAGD